MASPQPVYRFAWVLEILGPATVRAATTDLPEAAAVTTLGAFYTKRIKNIDTRIVDGLPNQFYGIRRVSGASFVLDNSDQAIDPTADWRGASFTLWHYDREQDVRRTDMQGLVTEVQFANGTAVFTFSTVDESLLNDLLPAATIDPAASSPFEDTASAGVPLPVVFGSDVLIKPPSINVDIEGSGTVSRFDYAAGFGSDIGVTALWGEWDRSRAGLEKYGSWETAPGSPAYQALELDATWRATHFTVTDDQRVRYQAGLPIRFKTTVSGSAYVYSVVKAYLAIGTPAHYQVEIHDALIDSGLNSVQIVGDYLIDRTGYTSVTTGILPEPATAQALTAIRLYGQEDSALIAMVSNPTYPSGSGGVTPATIIRDIIENNVWGLSTHVEQQVMDGITFAIVDAALADAGLDGAVQGALAYDQRQRSAEVVLDALLMMRGMRLQKLATGQWSLTYDSGQAVALTFSHGPGAESGTRIKKVISYGRVPLDRAVRNLVLHWSPIARTRSVVDTVKPIEYARFSTKAVTGRGTDLHIYNPFIRTQTIAELVTHYVAEKLVGADEQLVFVAGQEARDIIPGNTVTCTSTVDGFSGDWQVVEVSKSLADVQLTCIRKRSEAFDSPSGVTSSSEPTETANKRTSPGPGPNTLPNPDPAPPLRLSDDFTHFGAEVSGFSLPYGWRIGAVDGVLTELSFDKSEAVRIGTKSGHYGRMVWSSVTTGPPLATAGDGIFTEPGFGFSVTSGADHIISFYGDAADGWFLNVTENDLTTQSVLPLIRDTTDVDGNGWSRFYARYRPKNVTTAIILGLCVSQAGTYQFSSFQVEEVNGSARKPTAWRRHRTSESSLTRTTTITLDGSTTYNAAVIKAGDYVLGATIRLLSNISSGTHTFYDVGTTLDQDVYGRHLQLFTQGDETTSANYKAGTVATFFSSDTNIVITFNGTAVTGSIKVVLHYTRSFPTPGE